MVSGLILTCFRLNFCDDPGDAGRRNMKRAIRYKKEFTVTFSDSGNEKGYPVLVQHGMIASITDTHLFNPLLENGMRVISIARPGYGESSCYPMKSIGEWGDIVAAVVDELQISEFDVLGISSGAPYGYAIAHHFSKEARKIFILSGIPALYDPQVRAVWPYPLGGNSSIDEMQVLARNLFFSNLSDAELEKADIKDSMKHDCYGVALDLLIRGKGWGFTLAEVNQDVYLRHSQMDSTGSFAAAEITARLLPHGHFDIRSQDEHFSEAVLHDFIRTVMIPAMSE